MARCPFVLTKCFVAGVMNFSEDLEPDANDRIGVSAGLDDGEACATGRPPTVG
jgi:hypothetical protein